MHVLVHSRRFRNELCNIALAKVMVSVNKRRAKTIVNRGDKQYFLRIL